MTAAMRKRLPPLSSTLHGGGRWRRPLVSCAGRLLSPPRRCAAAADFTGVGGGRPCMIVARRRRQPPVSSRLHCGGRWRPPHVCWARRLQRPPPRRYAGAADFTGVGGSRRFMIGARRWRRPQRSSRVQVGDGRRPCVGQDGCGRRHGDAEEPPVLLLLAAAAAV